MTDPADLGRGLASLWNTAAIDLIDGSRPRCDTIRVLDNHHGSWRFAYISLASSVAFSLAEAVDATNGEAVDGYERLVNGSVLALVWRGPLPHVKQRGPDHFRAGQQIARRAVLTARHGLGAVALEELTSPVSVAQRSINALAAAWTPEASLVLDIATEITLGADRQRYVDPIYPARFQQRAAGLAARLAQFGIVSNPILSLS